MLVDIVNEQSLFEHVTLIVGNAAVEKTLVDRISARVNLHLLQRPQGSRNPWYMWKLYRMLKQLDPDIVHVHLDSFIHILKFIKSPRVLTVHTTGIQLTPQADKYNAIYGISDAVSRDLEKRYPGIVTRVIPNGINFSDIRKKRSYGHTPFRVVQISRLDHRLKGQDVLLRAVSKVNDLLGNGQVTVDFIGEGPSKDYLLKLSEELGIENCCRFMGMCPRNEVYENLHNYDLLAQPSRIEGFGLTIVEGMAAGVPVLVSDIEGPMEVIGRGRYGYYFRSEDADDCAKQILDIMKITTLPEFANVRKSAEQYAQRTYDVAATAKNYVMDYARVTGSRIAQSG